MFGKSLSWSEMGPTAAFARGARADRARTERTVLLICPGGLEHGGGIGRLIGYFLDAVSSDPAVRYRVIDTRGPWFLGASPAHAVPSLVYFAGALLQLAAYRLHRSPCIAHVNITGRGSTIRKTILVLAARALGMPYLMHVHDYDYAKDYLGRGWLMRRLVRAAFRGATRVIVLGEAERDRVWAGLQLRGGQLVVMHNAVPEPPDAPVPAHRPEAGPPRLLFLGHLSERKGVSDLLRALAEPEMASRAWAATLAGGGPVETYRRLAAELGIADRVSFPGWLDQHAVAGLCSAADILVLPSHAEGLAMAVLEGLAHGLAIVTTPVGAHGEVILDGRSGLLVRPGDHVMLGRTLSHLLDDVSLRQRLRCGARNRYLEGFTMAAYAERLQALHAEVFATQALVAV